MGTKLQLTTGQNISVKVKAKFAKQTGVEFIKGIVMCMEDDSIYIEQLLSYSDFSEPKETTKAIIRLFSLQQIDIIALS